MYHVLIRFTDGKEVANEFSVEEFLYFVATFGQGIQEMIDCETGEIFFDRP